MGVVLDSSEDSRRRLSVPLMLFVFYANTLAARGALPTGTRHNPQPGHRARTGTEWPIPQPDSVEHFRIGIDQSERLVEQLRPFHRDTKMIDGVCVSNPDQLVVE